MKNTHIYLIGYPGTGKYTIAKAMKEIEPHFKLVDNHLINNPVFSIIEQDGKTPLPQQVWDNIGKIWDVITDTMVNLSSPDASFIMTNFLREGCADDGPWFEEVRDMAEDKRGSLFIPVHLHCDPEENKKRIVRPDRAKRMKHTDPDAVDDWHENDAIITIDHPNFLKLDVNDLSPQDAAKAILSHAKSRL